MNKVPKEATSVAIDFNSALRDLNGDKELMQEIANIFVEDAPFVCQQLFAAIAQQRQVDAVRLVHRLKGMASQVRAEPVLSLALSMESLLKVGDWSALPVSSLDYLQEVVASTADALQQKLV